MARPSEYDASYCDVVIDLGREGAGKAEIAAKLGVVRQTIDNWAAAHPEFMDAIKIAREFSQGWWEAKGREATFGKVPGFNATAFIFNMKNRFPDDWRDKRELDVSQSHEQALDELDD